jgi:hypothetical protein
MLVLFFPGSTGKNGSVGAFFNKRQPFPVPGPDENIDYCENNQKKS